MADTAALLDRYAKGDLSREDERAIARAALDDPKLFEALMTAGAMSAALRREGSLDSVLAEGLQSGRQTTRRWPPSIWASVLTAAAAVLLFAIVYPNVWKSAPPSAAEVRVATAAPAGTASAPTVGEPVALGAPVEDLAGISAAEFRSARAVSRPPRTEAQVSIGAEDVEAVVPLGSLDGVTQGARLPIFHGSDRSEPVARMTISSVFREQSRGRVDHPVALRGGGGVAVVPAPLAVAALRQHMVALIAAGDQTGAHTAGQTALRLLDDAGVTVADQRGVLFLLGALERRQRLMADAITHLRAAEDLLDQRPAVSNGERAEILNELGAALIEAAQPEAAERVLRVAQETASGAAAMRVANNLGATALMRGDRSAAERLYRTALRAATDLPGTSDERRAIEKNLSDLTTVR